jgi:hypothetical protein
MRMRRSDRNLDDRSGSGDEGQPAHSCSQGVGPLLIRPYGNSSSFCRDRRGSRKCDQHAIRHSRCSPVLVDSGTEAGRAELEGHSLRWVSDIGTDGGRSHFTDARCVFVGSALGPVGAAGEGSDSGPLIKGRPMCRDRKRTPSATQII